MPSKRPIKRGVDTTIDWTEQAERARRALAWNRKQFVEPPHNLGCECLVCTGRTWMLGYILNGPSDRKSRKSEETK